MSTMAQLIKKEGIAPSESEVHPTTRGRDEARCPGSSIPFVCHSKFSCNFEKKYTKKEQLFHSISVHVLLLLNGCQLHIVRTEQNTNF